MEESTQGHSNAVSAALWAEKTGLYISLRIRSGISIPHSLLECDFYLQLSAVDFCFH